MLILLWYASFSSSFFRNYKVVAADDQSHKSQYFPPCDKTSRAVGHSTPKRFETRTLCQIFFVQKALRMELVHREVSKNGILEV